MNNFMSKKFENLHEMDKFLQTCNPPKLSQEEAECLNRLISASEIEAVIKKLVTHKSPIVSQENFTKYLRKS